jgi:hypothetical protein
MLEPSRHVKAISNVGVGLPFPLIEKKIMFCSLALSKKLSLIHGNFLIYQDVLHVAYYFFLKYIESYNNLDIKMKFHYMIRLMAV